MDSFQLCKDMKARTGGEIYIGVVGLVRTGKSTFIKRFMDLLVLPHMEDENDREHRIKQDLLAAVKFLMTELDDIRSVSSGVPEVESPYIEKILFEKIEMDTGKVRIMVRFAEQFYYDVLSELTGTDIQGEYELISFMKELASMKEEYTQMKMKGYGVVSPKKEEIALEDPMIIKQGNKFGVKIHSEAPSIYMIRANIETEIVPIVGSEKQAQDLVEYIRAESETEEGVWGTNIFGKSIEDLVMDGMRNKITMINDESQVKLQDTMQKIVNDSNGGLVCIII